MAAVADANKVQDMLKELTKRFAKELAVLHQTVAKLEQRVATLEKPQAPKVKQS
jgi:polyhydroxyalkanoate synthesis regulator phasin